MRDSKVSVEHNELLVVGAGPYGLSTAASARQSGIDVTVLGHSMGFWRDSMPEGMLLRSGVDWHLDAGGTYTLRSDLEDVGTSVDEVDPIPVQVFIDYAEWFRERSSIHVSTDLVKELTETDGRYEVTLESGERATAGAVVAAPGIANFPNVPHWVHQQVSSNRFSHTRELTRFEGLRGARCLIVGGRQSAYEWAALLAQQGIEEVHVVHRHESPSFEASDWTFVDELIDNTISTPGWFRNLPRPEREAIAKRFWAEGRLKLEPWLVPRLPRDSIHRWPLTSVVSCNELPTGELQFKLSSGESLVADHLILATGYKADLERVTYLAGLIDRVETADGFPVLDEHFQSSLPGLFFPGFVATRDFGPFFGFVKGCVAAATLITKALTRDPAAV